MLVGCHRAIKIKCRSLYVDCDACWLQHSHWSKIGKNTTIEFCILHFALNVRNPFLQFLILILMMNHLCVLKTVEPILSEGVAHCAMVWPVTRAVRVWRQSVWWDYHHQQPAAIITSAADHWFRPHTFTIKLLTFITLEQGQSQSSLYIGILDISFYLCVTRQICNFQTLK